MIIRNHKPTPLILSEEQKSSLRNGVSHDAPPSLMKKAKHAAQASVRVVKAAASGQPIRLSEEGRERRLAICRACDLWNEGGNVGLGECTHAKCGCTRFKHGLSTETCPDGKWEP